MSVRFSSYCSIWAAMWFVWAWSASAVVLRYQVSRQKDLGYQCQMLEHSFWWCAFMPLPSKTKLTGYDTIPHGVCWQDTSRAPESHHSFMISRLSPCTCSHHLHYRLGVSSQNEPKDLNFVLGVVRETCHCCVPLLTTQHQLSGWPSALGLVDHYDKSVEGVLFSHPGQSKAVRSDIRD